MIFLSDQRHLIPVTKLTTPTKGTVVVNVSSEASTVDSSAGRGLDRGYDVSNRSCTIGDGVRSHLGVRREICVLRGG